MNIPALAMRHLLSFSEATSEKRDEKEKSRTYHLKWQENVRKARKRHRNTNPKHTVIVPTVRFIYGE
jgi:hypothetical protein